MAEREAAHGVSRRAVLTGLGVAAAGVATGVGAGWSSVAGAASSGGQNDGARTDPAPSPRLGQSFLQSLPNPKTLMINTLHFVAVNNASYSYVAPGGLRPATSDFWNCPVDLPAGSTIQSVSVYLNPGGTSRFINLARYNPAAASFTDIQGTNSTAGNAVETATIANVNHVVLGAPWTYRIDNLSLGNTGVIYGASATYLPPPQGFVPISPIPRVYNTRDGGLPKLANAEERIVSLAPHVPATAQAAVVNLTVTATQAGGYVAMFAADVPWPGNSSVNWTFTNENVANVVLTGIDAASRVRIRGGGGSTHVIIDVLGYLTA
jgi:hypothetical protein